MPSLVWSSKASPSSTPAFLELDSVIYPHSSGYQNNQPENHLILGDNLAVMSALLPEYEGRINLIYADPPFFTNHHYQARIGQGEDSRRPREWQLAEGYPDSWLTIEAYLDMLYPRLWLMHRLLSPTGTLYLHLDWHAHHYARLLLDEIFGSKNLLNEIVWVYHGPSPIRSAFNRKHDIILAYTKSTHYIFNADAVREPYNPNTVKTFEASIRAGFGKMPDLKRGKVPEDWWYFPVVARLHRERTGYPTQKPEALLERVILASSNPGDIVADFFCGSGTTASVAFRLGRKFIANDASWRAVHTARARLIESVDQPFTFKIEAQTHLDRKNIHPNHLRINQNKLIIDEDYANDLDYWEVDPAWDGHTYHSVVQAIRPRSKQLITTSLELPETSQINPIAIRTLNIDGTQTQSILQGTNS